LASPLPPAASLLILTPLRAGRAPQEEGSERSDGPDNATYGPATLAFERQAQLALPLKSKRHSAHEAAEDGKPKEWPC